MLKRQKEKFKHLEVGINTVFSAVNQHKIFEIYSYISHLSPLPDCMAQLLIRSNPRESNSKQNIEIDKYREWTDMYAKDMLKGKFEKDVLVKIATILMYKYIYKTVTTQKRQIHCYAGIAGAVIDNEGMVGPCEHKPPYGSLRNNRYDFKKIWHSDLSEKMRHDSYNHCLCTNEPKWWHPSVSYNKELVDEGIALSEKLSGENKDAA